MRSLFEHAPCNDSPSINSRSILRPTKGSTLPIKMSSATTTLANVYQAAQISAASTNGVLWRIHFTTQITEARRLWTNRSATTVSCSTCLDQTQKRRSARSRQQPEQISSRKQECEKLPPDTANTEQHTLEPQVHLAFGMLTWLARRRLLQIERRPTS